MKFQRLQAQLRDPKLRERPGAAGDLKDVDVPRGGQFAGLNVEIPIRKSCSLPQFRERPGPSRHQARNDREAPRRGQVFIKDQESAPP